jgi:dTDP-4-dehydrorhamnose 3,5-epimerase
VPFQFRRLRLSEVVLVEAKQFPDNRGFFMEAYKLSDFSAGGIHERFIQVNHSRSQQGVLRGLHYQIEPKAQGKLVMVPRGRVFDVAMDIRRGSPTYGQWVAEELSAENGRMLWLPVGFAHGFCVLSDWADVIYMVTEEYSKEHERGILWNDPEIGIQWPIDDPTVSPRDLKLLPLAKAEHNFRFG